MFGMNVQFVQMIFKFYGRAGGISLRMRAVDFFAAEGALCVSSSEESPYSIL